MNLIRRRCLVCEWEAEVLEPPFVDGIGPPCASCGAPTERVEIMRAGIVPKNPHAVTLGRLGGLRGGRARADALSPERRQEIARQAARARWVPRARDGRPSARREPGPSTGFLDAIIRRYYHL